MIKISGIEDFGEKRNEKGFKNNFIIIWKCGEREFKWLKSSEAKIGKTGKKNHAGFRQDLSVEAHGFELTCRAWA